MVWQDSGEESWFSGYKEFASMGRCACSLMQLIAAACQWPPQNFWETLANAVMQILSLLNIAAT